MKKQLAIIAIIVTISSIPSICLAQMCNTVDGFSQCDIDVIRGHGVFPDPAVANVGQGAIYYDFSDDKWKCSEDGGAYVDFCSAGGGGGGGSTVTLQYNDSTQMTGTFTLDVSGTFFANDESPTDEWNLAIKEDGISLREINDGSETPTTNDFLQVDTSTTVKYRSLAEALNAGNSLTLTGTQLDLDTTLTGSFTIIGTLRVGSNDVCQEDGTNCPAGDVTAAANLDDNTLIRGDGGLKGIQDSAVLLDDSDNMSGVTSLIVDGTGDSQFATASGTLVVIDYSDNKVGVGDLTPDEIFTVAGTTQTTTLVVTGTFIFGGNPYAQIQDQKTAGTDGGTCTTGAWRTRDLNTEVYDDIGVTISSNQVTLPIGTYRVRAQSESRGANRARLKFYNITDTADTILGNSIFTADNQLTFDGRFRITASKTFEVQHYCETTSSVGFGSGTNFSVVEIFTNLIIERVAQ